MKVLILLLKLLGLFNRNDFHIITFRKQPTINKLKVGELVVVTDTSNIPKWAVLKCPGECGNVFRLPLNHSAKEKCWNITHDYLLRPTVSPSIRQRNACNAHFWIKKGKVIWCKDNRCQVKSSK